MFQLPRVVVVADHRVGESGEAQQRAVHGPVGNRIQVLGCGAGVHGVPVGMQDQRQLAIRRRRPVEISDHVEPRQSLDAQIFDDDALVLEARDYAPAGLEGGRLRVESGRQQQMPADPRSLLAPARERGPFWQRHGAVEVPKGVEAGVGFEYLVGFHGHAFG